MTRELTGMNEVMDRPRADACAKGTLRGIARTGILLLGAALASILLVDPPIPADAPGAAQSVVPASERWIELGATPRAEKALPAGLQVAFAADQGAAPVRAGRLTRSQPKTSGVRRASPVGNEARRSGDRTNRAT
jgi:hypothetical protein